MPVTLKEMNSVQAAPMVEYYSAIGVTPSKLAQTGKELLAATTVKHIKLKGWIDKRFKLEAGYKVIKGTGYENLIEHTLADNGVRTRAWMEICRQMGLYPAESVSLQHGFDDIISDVIREIHKTSKGLPPLPSQEAEE